MTITTFDAVDRDSKCAINASQQHKLFVMIEMLNKYFLLVCHMLSYIYFTRNIKCWNLNNFNI